MPKIISSSEWLDRVSVATKGDLYIIGWADESMFGAKCMILVRCLACSFEWESSADNLCRGRGCPCCAKTKRPKSRLTPEPKRIEQINSIDGIEFVGWVDGYKNNHSIVSVKCSVDGIVWSASLSSILSGTGCPTCSRLRSSSKRRLCQADCEKKINSIKNLKFVRWRFGFYRNNQSIAVVRCMVDGTEWGARFGNLVHSGKGCPTCAKSGYDPAKAGYLYALRSECGMFIKIGKSNKPRQRFKQLERSTPFKFYVIEIIQDSGGEVTKIESDFHRVHKSAGLSGFDGATEWLVYSDKLMRDIRCAAQ